MRGSSAQVLIQPLLRRCAHRGRVTPSRRPAHQRLNTVTPAPGLWLCGLSWFWPYFELSEMSSLWLCGWYSGDKVWNVALLPCRHGQLCGSPLCQWLDECAALAGLSCDLLLPAQLLELLLFPVSLATCVLNCFQGSRSELYSLWCVLLFPFWVKAGSWKLWQAVPSSADGVWGNTPLCLNPAPSYCPI